MTTDLLIVEAPTRFELVMEILQTSALPLGDGAIKNSFLEYQRVSYLSSAKSCQATDEFYP